MSNKLTPQEVFEHVKALWPSAESITKLGSGYAICYKQNEACSVPIDWPEGVTEWPPQPRWETPVLPDDGGKECEFSDDGKEWVEAMLIGYVQTYRMKWRSTNQPYNYCRIDRNKWPRGK